MIPRASASTFLAFLALAGCAPSEPYPSLAPRPIEQAAARDAVDPPPPAAPADAALDTRADALLAAVTKAAAAFDATLAAARNATTAASGAPSGSERWVTAQQLLSVLDADRSPVVSALAELDALRLDVAKRAAPVDTTRLDAAWAAAHRIGREQQAALDMLTASLARP